MPAGTSISAADPDELLRLRVIGAITDLYLLAEGSTGLVLIDQHAAHERVMFEQLCARVFSSDGKLESQRLLMPVIMDLGERLS